jgi:geranylgeranyl diphosphate synthase, type II
MRRATADVGAVLTDITVDVRSFIDEFLADRHPDIWLWDLVRDYPARAGKSIRPALCLLACRVFGGRSDDAVVSAAAIELLHNAFLIHDDIEDESVLRRGSPTLHEQAGVPLALNSGDALVMAALGLLDRNREVLGTRLSTAIVNEFDLMLRHTVEGQAIELGWRRDVVTDLDPNDYLDLIMRKTCWYTTIHPLRTGMLIGSLRRPDSAALVHFGLCLGAAFQIRDDLLNLVGDEARYGKEIFGDLYEGKRTLMLIHLLREVAEPQRRAIVEGFLSKPRGDRTRAEVEDIVRLMHEFGSIQFAGEFADGIRRSAYDSFDQTFVDAADSEDKELLRSVVDYMLDRQV